MLLSGWLCFEMILTFCWLLDGFCFDFEMYYLSGLNCGQNMYLIGFTKCCHEMCRVFMRFEN